uniref:Variant surface glycoprotein 1125.1004 n=1 Tax=Trypanosoma brucei TaxID=5691 RepID=A0A1J0R639_9TRYP|nr:variant surface glycoprotein 1125.1004 [Trypanosoma brucei]
MLGDRKTQTTRLLIAILVLLTALPQWVVPAAHMGLLKATWQPLCALTKELDEVPGEALQEVMAILSKASELDKEAMMLKIYSALTESESEAKKATTLAAHMRRIAHSQRQHFMTIDARKFLEASKASAYAKGRLDEFLQVAGSMKDSSNRGCLLAGGTQNGLTLTNGALDGVPCKASASQVSAQPRAAKTITATGIKGPIDGKENSDNIQHSGKQCRLFGKTNANGLGHTTDLEDPKLVWAGGYITIDTSGGADGKVTLTQLTPEGTKKIPEAKTWQDCIEAVGAMPAAASAVYTNGTAVLATSESAADLFGRLRKNIEDGTLSNTKTEITAMFGEQTEVQVNKLLSNAANYQLKEKIGGKNKGTKLNEIGTAAELEAVLAAVDIKLIETRSKLIKQLNEENQKKGADDTTKTSETDETCQAKGTGDKCTSPCKEVEEGGKKKCTLDKEAKQTAEGAAKQEGKDGKTVDCSKLYTQEKCEKANEGQATKVCGWKGENTDGSDKSGYKCRNGSFLVKKQFALSVVSAAFVGFIEFKSSKDNTNFRLIF